MLRKHFALKPSSAFSAQRRSSFFFFGFLKLCRRPQQLLLAAVPWQPPDAVLARERGLRGLLVSHEQIKSRPPQALLCCSLRQLHPVPSAPCTPRRRCDALLDILLSAGSRSVAVASLRMWELRLLEGEMVPFLSCLVLQDVKQDGVCGHGSHRVSQSWGNERWTVCETPAVGRHP